ncbi:hypothetical protein Zmor_024364 [Zophobas morio]|uniref:Uncharacterized protein n=2 Tax=Zophobas morio TaxID=2755281 RepID=A0AA38M8N6_9CUCU|nr:hypothetical protein Zmor_024364 [Zophobas morio]
MVANESGKTAIEVAWDQKNNNTHYYICELIGTSSYLEKAIKNALSNSSDSLDEEHITTLLTYATDLPDIFDRVVVNFELPNFIQDMVFFHKFDEYSSHVMQFNTLLKLAEQNPFLFHKAFEYEFKFCFAVTDKPLDEKRNFGDLLISLISLKNDYLEILLEKCAPEICQIFEKCALHSKTAFPKRRSTRCGCGLSVNYNYTDLSVTYQCEKMFSKYLTIDKLELLLEKSETVSQCVIRFIDILRSTYFLTSVTERNNESTTTEIFNYLLMYGLRVQDNLSDVVYRRYGYCELFRVCLHMDIEDASPEYSPLNFILDVNFDVEQLPEKWKFYSDRHIQYLLDYFAHPKVYELVSKLENETRLRDDNTRKKVEKHPRVPLLVELSRNIFRKYFIERFQIRNTKMLYSLINGLSIASTHKKIITFETKLYDT